MTHKALTGQEADQVISIGSRLYTQLIAHNAEIIGATGILDPGKLADAIAAAQADLAKAYADVTAIVAGC